MGRSPTARSDELVDGPGAALIFLSPGASAGRVLRRRRCGAMPGRRESGTCSVGNRMRRGRLWRSALFGGLVLSLLLGVISARAEPLERGAEVPIPLLAYYYIWFDPGSWERAKSDLPLLGPYSSDDERVMRQHVAWAKQVGIEGFIVSWKSTDQLNRRLEQLIEIAGEEDFKLSIIYQGLDFERQPLPTEQISEDLEYFVNRYAEHEAFDMFNRPLVIWSGTWEFSKEEIAEVAEQHRDRLLILASERQADTYLELADAVDGNAYYWSSVDPDRFPDYQGKLDEMSQAVHTHGGLWIAPAAPGFDARLIEGSRVVERKDGQTLLKQMGVAFKSSPDAVGLISWNEFSENTHVEPSRNYGMRSLEVLAEIRGGVPPEIVDFESSEPATIQLEPNPGRLISLGLLGMLLLVSLAVLARRGISAGRGG